jgi:hypothetical protein
LQKKGKDQTPSPFSRANEGATFFYLVGVAPSFFSGIVSGVFGSGGTAGSGGGAAGAGSAGAGAGGGGGGAGSSLPHPVSARVKANMAVTDNKTILFPILIHLLSRDT